MQERRAIALAPDPPVQHDDDASIRQICREVLELGGYQVRDAGSATAALTEARRFRPDMIVLSVKWIGRKTMNPLRSAASVIPPK